MWSFSAWRRQRTLARYPIAPEQWQAVREHLPLLDGISAEEDHWLREACILFLHEKHLTTLPGVELSDEQRLFLAAQAQLPLLHLADLEQLLGLPNGERLGAEVRAELARAFAERAQRMEAQGQGDEAAILLAEARALGYVPARRSVGPPASPSTGTIVQGAEAESQVAVAPPAVLNAIFAATDSLAMASLARLKVNGIAVPEQVLVIGFDDLPMASQTAPPLTTVRQDIRAGAFAMVDLLMRRLAGEVTESIVMPPRLVARKTA